MNTDPRSSFLNGNDVLNSSLVSSTQSENVRNSSNFQFKYLKELGIGIESSNQLKDEITKLRTFYERVLNPTHPGSAFATANT